MSSSAWEAADNGNSQGSALETRAYHSHGESLVVRVFAITKFLPGDQSLLAYLPSTPCFFNEEYLVPWISEKTT